jgi:putative membrane protein
MSLDENGHDEVRGAELNTEQLHQNAGSLKGGKRSWLWRTIAALFVTLLAIEAVDFFIAGFEQSPVITSLYALLLAALTLVSGNYLWREFVGLKQFKKRQEMKQKATELLLIDTEQLTEKSNKRGKAFCDKINENLPCDLVFDCPKEQQVWHDALAADYSSTELVQLYSRVVLTKVDDKALNEVAKFSTEAVVLVALSPIALLDMLIMLSRNLRMINKIAGLYGLKLGYWSRIKLIKQVFVNMAYAGASELVADFGSDMLGAELLGKLSARFAQGLGAGMLTARLGAKTMELCRPIPFEDKPKLTHVRKKIAQQIKSLVSPVKK